MPGKISPRFVPLLVFSLLVVYCSYCLASERPSFSGGGKGPWDAAQTGKVGDVGSASSTTKQAETKVHFDQDESSKLLPAHICMDYGRHNYIFWKQQNNVGGWGNRWLTHHHLFRNETSCFWRSGKKRSEGWGPAPTRWDTLFSFETFYF
jgi:hypothetical protein